jgi:HEAT repeat protein
MIDQSPQSIEEILEYLREQEHISLPLLYQLTDMSPIELDTFFSSWSQFESEKRRLIIRHLADISEENFQVDFTEIFAHCLFDEAAAVRKASLDGLWDSDKLSLIDPIIDVMERDEDISVRALAAATLGHFVLLAEWQQIPLNRSEPIVEALVKVLENNDTPIEIRRSALEAISASASQRVPNFIDDAYESDDTELRISAIFAMGRSADSRWLPEITTEMASARFEMRVEAARAAGGIGHTDSIQDLAQLLIDDELEVKLAAISSLGKIGGDRAQELLEALADDPEFGELQEAALDAMEELTWLGGDIDLSFMDWENSGDAEPFLSA